MIDEGAAVLNQPLFESEIRIPKSEIKRCIS